MKRLRNLCIAIIVLVGLSFSANAQTDSGTTPAIGTEHGYWVNANANGAGQASGVGNSFLWYVTKGDLTNPAPGTDVTIGEFDAADPAYIDASTAVVDLYRINLTWLAASAGSTYYLHIIETDATDGCSNHKVEIIEPFSDFQLAIANVNNDFTAANEDLKVCAPNVTPVLNAGAIEYNYGTTVLYYKVDATNIDKANYTLGYNITVNAAFTGTVNASYGTVAGTTYTSVANLTTGSNQTQSIDNSANNATNYIRVELVNATGFEGTTQHDVLVTLLTGVQGAANATIGADADKNQIVPARPSTSGIGSN